MSLFAYAAASFKMTRIYGGYFHRKKKALLVFLSNKFLS